MHTGVVSVPCVPRTKEADKGMQSYLWYILSVIFSPPTNLSPFKKRPKLQQGIHFLTIMYKFSTENWKFLRSDSTSFSTCQNFFMSMLVTNRWYGYDLHWEEMTRINDNFIVIEHQYMHSTYLPQSSRWPKIGRNDPKWMIVLKSILTFSVSQFWRVPDSLLVKITKREVRPGEWRAH